MTPPRDDATRELKFRDPGRARALTAGLARVMGELGRGLAVMHVCGTHEQAIARYGLRAVLPRGLEIIMGPGCPVCVTDRAEVDEAVALAERGICVATYGDVLRVPGTSRSLADARARGGRVEVVYGVAQAVALARRTGDEVVFFATGFETTAVTTAAAVADAPPPNFSVLSAHKYVPPAMELVAGLPRRRVEGFLAAGHAATITGFGLFEPFAARHRLPVVVAGFEPLDILAALLQLVELVRDGRAEVVNAYPRCVTRDGNRRAQEQLWSVFATQTGRWRGIADVPEGNLRLLPEWAAVDARRRFDLRARPADGGPEPLGEGGCRCGEIMVGLASPSDCALFGGACAPATPVGACMVSSEGACRIWHEYGGHPDLEDTRP